MTGAASSQIAIVGYAQSPITRRSELSLGALAARTARDAIADAGLTLDDIDGFVTAPLFPTLGSHDAVDGAAFVTGNWLARNLGAVPRLVLNVQGQFPASMRAAANAIAGGAARHVVVHRALHNPAGRYHLNARSEFGGDDQWGAPQGHFGPITAIALAYNEYVQRHGVPEDALAAVVMEARKNGARIPWSFWHGRPLEVAAHHASPMLNDPIRVLDCDIPVDGVSAFVLTSAERGRDRPHAPVYLSGFSEARPTRRRVPSLWPLDDIMADGDRYLRQFWRDLGMTIADIDYVQVYDGFSPLVFFWLELLGLCPHGEAHRLVAAGGIDSDDLSAMPVLASGGALGNGRMHGVPQLLDCYLQLAGRAGERQRDRPSIALACQGFPHLGGTTLLSAAPL